jgi:rhodanese-related sulfurtransferase
MVSRNREFKDAIYEQFARIGKAISSPRRLELLDLICQGERTVEVLAREAGMSIANASQHLQALREARLVEAEKSGLYVTYRLSDEDVCAFVRSVRLLAENRLMEIDEITRDYLDGRVDFEPVDRSALLEQVQVGKVTVLDVRPVEEYIAGHIPGAVSVPLGDLQHYLDELPQNQKIVAYCRGPYCVLAVQAVEMLRAQGYDAVRLEDGVPDWKARGLPVAAGME